MKPFKLKKHDMELGCFIDYDGVIQIHMSGNLSSDYADDLSAWSAAVRVAMREAKERDSERVFCIIDLTGGVEADQESLTRLIDLVKHNKKFVTRTGIFGASLILRSFVDIALKATGRTNMKVFLDREQAEQWVLTGKSEAELKMV